MKLLSILLIFGIQPVFSTDSVKIMKSNPWIVNPRPVEKSVCVNINEVYNDEVIKKLIASKCKLIEKQEKKSRYYFECNSDYVNKYGEDTYFYQDKKMCKKHRRHSL